MSELNTILTNPVEAASVFSKYYNSSRYFDDLERWFNIETGLTPGGYVIKLIPVLKNEKGFRLGHREELSIDEYCFSVMTLYYSLIPQAIASVLDNAAMYRFHRASGLPMLTCDQNVLLAPGQILKEAGLFPSDDIIDIYSSFVYNVRDFLRREMNLFFSGSQLKEAIDTDAYHILCDTMSGHEDDFWQCLEKELDNTFFPTDGEAASHLYFANTPIPEEVRKQSISEAELLYKWQVSTPETQAIMSTTPHTTSRRRNSLKVTPRVAEILDKWNEGMRRMYFVSGDFDVQLMMGLYAIKQGHNMDVLDLMNANQRLNVDLEQILTPEDIKVLRNNYTAVANHCFSRAYHPQILPNKAFDALVHFLDAKPGMSVFNPFFSAQSFVYRLTSEGCHCEAFEMGAIRWGMSNIYLESRNLMFKHPEMPTMASYAESIEEIGTHRQYDRIVAYVKDEDQENFDDTLKQWIRHCLKPDGLIGVLLPEAANVATDRWRNLRRHLVEKGQLRGVVRLPDSKETFAIWLVGHEQKESPFFFNFEAYATANDLQEQSELFLTRQDPSLCYQVPVSKLKSTGYSFNPLRYLPAPETDDNLTVTTLGKLLELKSCELVEEGYGLWIGLSKVRDKQSAFVDNPLDCTVTEDRLREKEFTSAVVVPQPSLLAIDHLGTMRVARLPESLQLSDRKVHVASRAFVFSMRSQARCTEDYLLWLITSAATNEQVRNMSVMQCRQESMQLRYCKSYLMPDDFKAIRVELPPVAEQLRILESDKRGHLAQLVSEQGERFQALERDLSVKRHSIGQTLFRTTNWLGVLMKMLEKSGGVLRQTDKVDDLPYTVRDVFGELDVAFHQLSDKVKSLRNDVNLDCQVFDLRTFTEKFIGEHHYDVCTLLKDWQDNVDVDVLVSFPPEALTQILENILSNAVSHGFNNRRKSENNRVLFSFAILDGTRVELTVSNNGARLSPKMDHLDPFEYGTTVKPEPDSERLRITTSQVHSGIGGYQIRQLMQEFGGEAYLDSTPQQEYTVCYRLIFKLVNNR